jgi:hypothetical protein
MAEQAAGLAEQDELNRLLTALTEKPEGKSPQPENMVPAKDRRRRPAKRPAAQPRRKNGAGHEEAG